MDKYNSKDAFYKRKLKEYKKRIELLGTPTCRIYKEFYENYKTPPKKETPPKEAVTSGEFLKQYNITTNKEWFKWLLKNHPDKGCELALCQEIIAAGEKHFDL